MPLHWSANDFHGYLFTVHGQFLLCFYFVDLRCLFVDEFIVRVVDLMRKVPVDLVIQWGQCFSRYVSLPNIDALCAAYVLVTVKLIFCLNDRVERSVFTQCIIELFLVELVTCFCCWDNMMGCCSLFK